MIDLSDIRNKRILVVGDLMLDIYMHGTASRISPEAPVPVVVIGQKETVPGGAANVMNNLQALGCQVTGAGFVGTDDEGHYLLSSLQNLHINTECVMQIPYGTVSKTRVLANGQHIVRCDLDYDFSQDPDLSKYLLETISSALLAKRFDAIVVSDYAKGTVFAELVEMLKHSGVPVIGDLKPQHKDMFRGVWSIAPNLLEAQSMLNIGQKLSPQQTAHKIKSDLELNTIIITLSDQGILCIDENDMLFEFPAHVDIVNHDPKHRLDVTGAGDTVISVFAACVASGMETRKAVFVANVAAGIVVRKIGTVTCSFVELVSELGKISDWTASAIQ